MLKEGGSRFVDHHTAQLPAGLHTLITFNVADRDSVRAPLWV